MNRRWEWIILSVRSLNVFEENIGHRLCETAAKWTDSQARLQFRFFLNLFNCLLTTNLSRRNNRGCTGPQTLLNFEGTATDSEFPLNSTFIHAILLLPEMFTRPRQDANDLFFILRPWCNVIRVRTPPGVIQSDKNPIPTLKKLIHRSHAQNFLLSTFLCNRLTVKVYIFYISRTQNNIPEICTDLELSIWLVRP